AHIRNLKPATIVEHLCYLVEKKLPVEIDKFVNNKKKRAIEEVIGKIGKGKLAPIKEELGDDFSWDEIKLVLASCK
ncbi:MAG: helix-turn-helix domain-containing protein, partial [Patescibacteria group bacterium]